MSLGESLPTSPRGEIFMREGLEKTHQTHQTHPGGPEIVRESVPASEGGKGFQDGLRASDGPQRGLRKAQTARAEGQGDREKAARLQPMEIGAGVGPGLGTRSERLNPLTVTQLHADWTFALRCPWPCSDRRLRH